MSIHNKISMEQWERNLSQISNLGDFSRILEERDSVLEFEAIEGYTS